MVDQKRRDELLTSIELFFFAYRAFTAGPDQILEQRGLGRVHHRILYFVGRNPSISVNALLKVLDVSKQALNIPLRQLIDLQLVTVSIAQHDRRLKQLALSTDGRRLEERLTATQIRHLSNAFEQAGDSASETWRDVMRRMVEG